MTTVDPVPLPAARAKARATEPDTWVEDLTSVGALREDALARLHALLLRASRHQVSRMRGALAGAGPDRLDELANQAADEAMVSLLSRLSTFEGRSRFTTWAYKFAILQASVEVRRQVWRDREVPLERTLLVRDDSASPEQYAEAAELAEAVRRAIEVALTPHQRDVAVALLVDEVAIDVLAERLGTTRNALYKTLHDARVRLRAHLTAGGHLAAVTPTGAAP